MKKITFQSDKFYVAVPHDKGEALFEFTTQDDQDNFIQELEARGDLPYALTPLQIKLEVHKELSNKFAGGLPYLIIRKLAKEGVVIEQPKAGTTAATRGLTAVLNELSPYLRNKRGYSYIDNIQVHLNNEMPLLHKWIMSTHNVMDKHVSFTKYLTTVTNRVIDSALLPPSKPRPVKN